MKEFVPKAFSINDSLFSNPVFLKLQSPVPNDPAIFSLKAIYCIVLLSCNFTLKKCVSVAYVVLILVISGIYSLSVASIFNPVSFFFFL